MKRDERLIRKALLGLREGEPDAGFPDRTEKNRELAAAYAPLQPVGARPRRRRRLVFLAASLAVILTLSVTGVVLWQSEEMLGHKLTSEQVTRTELHTALSGIFTVHDEIGDYTIEDDALVYRNRRGRVVYSEINYSGGEGGMELTLIAIRNQMDVNTNIALFDSLQSDGEINDKAFKYEVFEESNDACANINIGGGKRIWLYLVGADEAKLFEIIDELTR